MAAHRVRASEIVALLDEARALTLTRPSPCSPTYEEEYAAWRWREVAYFARKADLLARIAVQHGDADAGQVAEAAQTRYEEKRHQLVADTLADLDEDGGGR